MSANKYSDGGRLNPRRFPEQEAHVVHPRPSLATRVMDGILWIAVIVIVVVVAAALVGVL